MTGDERAKRFVRRPFLLVASIVVIVSSVLYGLPLLGTAGDSAQTVGAIGWMVAVPLYALSLFAGEHR